MQVLQKMLHMYNAYVRELKGTYEKEVTRHGNNKETQIVIEDSGRVWLL